jgi:hypothetical protein
MPFKAGLAADMRTCPAIQILPFQNDLLIAYWKEAESVEFLEELFTTILFDSENSFFDFSDRSMKIAD